MADFLLSAALSVAKIPGKGLGIVARARIEAGTVVERAPILVCAGDSIPESGHPLSDYVFAYGEDLALGLGYTCLYNHSRNPNCAFAFDPGQPVLVITAIRAIMPGEEVTIDYAIPLWFTEA